MKNTKTVQVMFALLLLSLVIEGCKVFVGPDPMFDTIEPKASSSVALSSVLASTTSISSTSSVSSAYTIAGTWSVSASVLSSSASIAYTSYSVSSVAVTIDGSNSEWTGISSVLTDPFGDTSYLPADIVDLKMAAGGTSVYFLMQTNANIDPSAHYYIGLNNFSNTQTGVTAIIYYNVTSSAWSVSFFDNQSKSSAAGTGSAVVSSNLMEVGIDLTGMPVESQLLITAASADVSNNTYDNSYNYGTICILPFSTGFTPSSASSSSSSDGNKPGVWVFSQTGSTINFEFLDGMEGMTKTGSVTGNTVTMSFSYSDANQTRTINITGTFVSATQVTGTYTSSCTSTFNNCDGYTVQSENGTFSMSQTSTVSTVPVYDIPQLTVAMDGNDWVALATPQIQDPGIDTALGTWNSGSTYQVQSWMDIEWIKLATDASKTTLYVLAKHYATIDPTAETNSYNVCLRFSMVSNDACYNNASVGNKIINGMYAEFAVPIPPIFAAYPSGVSMTVYNTGYSFYSYLDLIHPVALFRVP